MPLGWVRLAVLAALLLGLLTAVAGAFVPGDTGWFLIDVGALTAVSTLTGLLLDFINHPERHPQ